MAYTDVTLDDASAITAQADLSPVKNIESLSGGWANSNYLLHLNDESKVVLKIWNERTPKQVEELLVITSWLVKEGVPTPAPIRFDYGELMIIKNGLAWTLLPYVESKWLESDEKSLFTLGCAQAQLHATNPPPTLGTDFSMGFSLFEKLFQYAEEKGEWSDFLIMLKNEYDGLKMIGFNELPSGVIHGDLFSDNVLGSPEKIDAILDFEEVCIGPFAFDLIMTFVGFGWQDGKPISNRWEAILSGYESVRTLEPIERESLQKLHMFATLSIAAWRYWQFVINMPKTEHTNRYVEMVERLDKPLPF